MALRIWLPLNGNINNQGLYGKCLQDGSLSYGNGKIGQALFLETANANNGIYIPKQEKQVLSVALWFKAPGYIGTRRDICNEGRDYNTFGWRIGLEASSNNLKVVVGSGVTYTQSFTPDKWYHVAFTRDESKVVKTYINGVLVDTKTNTADLNYSESNGFINIGRLGYHPTNNSKIYPYQGYINDFRFYDECLSPKQIKEISKGLVAHYKLIGTGANENLILRSDKITSAGSANGITHTLLADGSMKVVSESGNGNYCSFGFAENSNTNVGNKLSVGDTYTISCDIKVEEGTKFPNLFINNGNSYKRLGGPVLKLNTWQRVYYTNTWNTPGTQYGNISLHLGFSDAIGTYYFKNFKLEKGNLTPWRPAPTDPLYISDGYDNDICTDVSGYNNIATKNGTLSFSENAPRYNGSTIFDSGYLHLIPSPLNTDTDSFTISCWFYPTRSSTQAIINDRTSVGEGLSIFYYSGSNMRFDTGESYQWVVGGGNFALNRWNYIVFTWDKNSGEKKYYLDGELIASTTNYGTLAKIGNVFSIGNSSTNSSAGAGNQVHGSISDYRIYATALSADDIKELYQVSAFIDDKDNICAYEFREE